MCVLEEFFSLGVELVTRGSDSFNYKSEGPTKPLRSFDSEVKEFLCRPPTVAKVLWDHSVLCRLSAA